MPGISDKLEGSRGTQTGQSTEVLETVVKTRASS